MCYVVRTLLEVRRGRGLLVDDMPCQLVGMSESSGVG